MTDRQAAIVILQVLLGHIGDIFSILIFGEQMIKRLLFARSYFLRYGLIPFFRIIIFRIHIKYDTAEIIKPVAHYLADLEFCGLDQCIRRVPLSYSLHSPYHTFSSAKIPQAPRLADRIYNRIYTGRPMVLPKETRKT